MKRFYWEARGQVLTEDQISRDDAHEFLEACLDRDNGAIAIDEVILSVKEVE